MSGTSPGAGDDYDPSKDPKGRGAWITWGVLGTILLVVLACAYSLHAFWWQ